MIITRFSWTILGIPIPLLSKCVNTYAKKFKHHG
jgi:hypothetical protein